MPWVEIVVALISAASTLGAVLLTNYLRNRRDITRNQNIEDRVRRDMVVYQILNDIRERFNFGRITVYQFHNGSKYYTGEAIQKASVSFETVAPGVTPMSNAMQDVPLGTMVHPMSMMANIGHFCIDDVDNIEDPHYANLIKAFDTTSHYAFKIEDDRGWIGIIVADYCSSQTINNAQQLTDACIEYMKVQASRLSTLLTISNRSYNINE